MKSLLYWSHSRKSFKYNGFVKNRELCLIDIIYFIPIGLVLDSDWNNYDVKGWGPTSDKKIRKNSYSTTLINIELRPSASQLYLKY